MKFYHLHIDSSHGENIRHEYQDWEFESPSGWDIFWHLHKNIRFWVENECCSPRAVYISNVNFTTKISILPEPVFRNMGQQMSAPDSSNG